MRQDDFYESLEVIDSNLSQENLQIYLSFLQPILDIFQKPDLEDVKDQVKEHINQELNCPDKNICKNLQNLLSECFKLTFRKNYANFQFFDEPTKIAGVQKLRKYIECLKIANEYRSNPNTKFFTFFKLFFELCKQNRQSIFWSNQNGQTFIELLILWSRSKEQNIIQFLENFEGSLTGKVYASMNIETILFRILKAIIRCNSDKKNKYGEFILDIALRKGIDLNDGDIDGAGGYGEQIVQCGVEAYELEKAMLIMNTSIRKEDQVQYIIYNDQKKGQKKRINLGQQFNCQMKTYLTIVAQKGHMIMGANQNYQLQAQINQGKLIASFKQKQQTFSGILIPLIQPFLDEYQWEIFDQINWRRVSLKDQRKNQLLKNYKTKRNQFQLLLTEMDFKLQIDFKKFRVKKVCPNRNQPEPFGIIYWKPIFNMAEQKNNQILERQTHDEDEQVPDNIFTEKLFQPVQDKKVLIQLDNQSKQYPLLAILADHIPTSCNYRINRQQKSIKVFGQVSIRKINRWLDQLQILVLETFNGDLKNPKQVQLELQNQEVLQTVKQKMDQFLPANFRQNIVISKGVLKVVQINRNENFVKDFINYLIENQLENLNKKKYTIQVPKENVQDVKTIIKYFDDTQIQVNTNSKLIDFGRSKKPNQIDLKAKTQKIVALVEAVNDQNSITHSSQNLAGLLHYQDSEPQQYIDSINGLMITQEDNKFQITGKKIPVFAFWAKFNRFLQKAQEENFKQQKVTIKFPGQGPNFKMFESITENLPDAQVYLKGNDIEVETYRKNMTDYEANFKNKLKEIKFDIIEKSKTQFQLKNIQDKFSRYLEKMLKNKIAELKLSNNANLGHIECDLINSDQTTYKFTLKRGNQQEIKEFNKMAKNFKLRYSQYKNQIYLLRKTNQIEKDALNPLRQIKLTSKQETETLLKLTQKYKLKIHKLIEDIFQQQKKLLENYFIDFLFTKSIQHKFNSPPQINIQDTLDQKNQGIFYEYLEQMIQQKSKNLPLRKEQFKRRKQFIIDRVQLKVHQLDQDLINKNLQSTKVKRTMMAIKVLVASYFTTNLPIVSHLQDFAACIQKYDNIVVKTGTGSGKSTMLPPYLIAMGFDRVVVTQPRRLPCAMICKRIKKTHSEDLVGYSFAGAQYGTQNPLHYTTDGYLKVQLYSHPKIAKDIDVLLLDQIHERSKNIDLILAKISELRKINPKLKVVLCSATVDQNIINIIDNSNNYGVFNVEVKRHEVKQFKIQNQSILEKANDLSARLKKNQKMLIFFPGIDEVNQAVTTFREKYKKLAFPLHGAQKNSQQDEIIENGQIFVATSIAQTSLTFENLKFVLDSRKARYVTFNEARGTYVTEEKIASKSSATQRKGRVGRDCPGEYYYFENLQTGRMKQDDFDMTELDRIDLTNVVFELMIEYKDMKKVRQILKRLMNDSQSFRRKFEYSLNVLKQLRIIDSSQNLRKSRQITQILGYGSLGDIRFNIALTKGNQIGCSQEIAIIIAFLMYGSKILDSVLSSIPSNKHHASGDIMTICIWMSKICQNIKLKSLALKDIYTEARKFPQILNKPYFSTIIRILKQIKKFFYIITNLQSCLEWDTICDCLMHKAFTNQIYFHEVNLGGQKGTYSKLIDGTQYISNRNKFNQIHYKINRKSLLYQSDYQKLPLVVLSLSSFCNTVEDSTLSFCSLISKQCQRNIQFAYEASEQSIPYEIPTINEKQYFNNQIGGSYNNSKFSYKAPFNKISEWYKSFSDKLFSKGTEIDLNNILEKQIKAKNIDENRSKILKEQYQKIIFHDIFSPLIFEFGNLYDVKIKIKYKKMLVITNASNYLLRAIVKRIKCFFTWFVMCQNICIEDKKVDPQLIHKNRIDQNIAKGIQKRIDMIVDSSIEYHIVRSWTHSQTNQYSSRTMRMVAVCWILTTKFYCSIKGGFVRDWVVRNHQSLPNINLVTILGRSPLNGHLEVLDQTVSPVDIDADLPSGRLFDIRKFYQEMLKLNIQMHVSDPEECSNGPDYWRIHIVFDKDSPTGPFTADLIQPYCQIAHDKCDFDVNLFYLKKDWKGAIGLKIPLQIRPVRCDNDNNDIRYTLEELLKNCIDRKMKQINAQVGLQRRRKFQNRGWTVDPIIYQPTIYKSRKTTSYRMDVEEFKKSFPEFMQKMPNSTIVEVRQLKNSNWDQCYDSVRQWIINDGQKTNEKFLFHGSKEAGIIGVYEGGFDSRYFAKDGYYGRGAYFADDSSKSHQYVDHCPRFNNLYCMFVCKVALGKQEHCKKAANGKLGPQPGYHSILGTAGSHTQYIIDRYGQAKPMFLIKYR